MTARWAVRSAEDRARRREPVLSAAPQKSEAVWLRAFSGLIFRINQGDTPLKRGISFFTDYSIVSSAVQSRTGRSLIQISCLSFLL